MGTWLRRLGRAVACLATVSALSVACGGDSEEDGDPAAPVTSAGIGPAGGVVASPFGAEIRVPAGALDSNVTLSISIADDAPAVPDELTALGDVYALTPHGQEFLKPVTIRIPFAGGTNPELYTAPDGGSWSRVAEATANAGVMSASVEHFSFFVVVEAQKIGRGGSSSSGGSPATGDGGSPSAQGGTGSGNEGGSTGAQAGSGSDGGGASAQAGSGSDSGGAPAVGAGGAGGSGPVCDGLCGHNLQPCCASDGGLPDPETCAMVGGFCLEQGTACSVDGVCQPIFATN